jgi:hypothetical protein
MHILFLLALLWVALAVPAARFIGRGLRVADQRDLAARTIPNVPDFVPADWLGAMPSRRDAV